MTDKSSTSKPHLPSLFLKGRVAILGLLNPSNFELYHERGLTLTEGERLAFEYLEETGGVPPTEYPE